MAKTCALLGSEDASGYHVTVSDVTSAEAWLWMYVGRNQ